MNKKSILMQAGLLMGLTLSLTSCDDILGEWDRPTPQAEVPAAETAKYLVWNSTSKALEEQEIPSGYVSMTNTTTEWNGNYIVDSDVDIMGDVTISGDVNIILKDGKTLTVHYKVAGDHKLCIFAQSKDAATAGKLDFAAESAAEGSDALNVGELQIHGGVINASGRASSSSAGGEGIETSGKLYIYAGNVKAYGGAASGASGNGGTAISCLGKDFQICLADVTATGGNTSGTGSGGNGIAYSGASTDPYFKIDGGTVKAIAGDGTATAGVKCTTIDVNSGKFYAQGNATGQGVDVSNFYYTTSTLAASGGASETYGTDIANGAAPTHRYVKVEPKP